MTSDIKKFETLLTKFAIYQLYMAFNINNLTMFQCLASTAADPNKFALTLYVNS